MNLESLLPPLEGIWDVSIIILLMGVVLYYFGKLICGVKIWEFEKEDYYFQGFSFFLAYLAVPLVLTLSVFQFLGWIIPFFVSLLVLLIVSGLLGIGVMFNVVNFRLFAKFKVEYKQRVSEKKPEELVKKINEKLGTNINFDVEKWTNLSFESYESVAKISSKKSVLFFFSFLTIWISLSTYYSHQINLESMIVFLLVLIIYTLIPIQFSYSDLIKPFVKIILNDGTEYQGRLQKMGKYSILTLENEEKTLSINSKNIKLIEVNIVMDKKIIPEKKRDFEPSPSDMLN